MAEPEGYSVVSNMIPSIEDGQSILSLLETLKETGLKR